MTTTFRLRTYNKDLAARDALKRRQQQRAQIEERAMIKSLGLRACSRTKSRLKALRRKRLGRLAGKAWGRCMTV